MTDEPNDTRDDELRKVLRTWEAPDAPEGMDERVLAAFRRQAPSPGPAPAPFWQRWLTSSIRVPVPVALALALLLVVTAALALRPESPPPTAVAPAPSEPVQAARRDTPVVTGTSLAGFQPVTEVTASVVQEGTP
jgi:hypothetical protein